MGYYNKQAVCLNGHQLSNHVKPESTYRNAFCPKCGAKVIINCMNCKAQIEGSYETDGIFNLTTTISEKRLYCSTCGIAYPWTQSLIDDAVKIAELDELDKISVNTIEHELPNVLVESQKTTLAKAKITKTAKNMSDSAKLFMRDLLKDVMTEVVIRQMFGN